MSNSTYHERFYGLYIDHFVHIKPNSNLLSRHTHNEFELLYILSGDITYIIEDRKYKLKKHDLVVIRPNDYHLIQIDSSADYERYDILFNPNILNIDNIDLLSEELDVINCKYIPLITDLFKKIDYYHSVMQPDQLIDVVTLLLKELIFNLNLSNNANNILSENVHPMLKKALTEINSNLFTIKNIESIAKSLFVTESYLYRIFKRELKTTPLKYINEKRLHIAQALLMQGKSPTDVYRECGFDDYTSFYRNYVKLFGYSPSKEQEIRKTAYQE